MNAPCSDRRGTIIGMAREGTRVTVSDTWSIADLAWEIAPNDVLGADMVYVSGGVQDV